MNLKITGHFGKAIPPKSGALKRYRQTPWDKEAALLYAAWDAKKNNRELVVYPGNSYGSFVYNTCLPKDCCRTNCNGKTFCGYLVKPDGEIWTVEEAA